MNTPWNTITSLLSPAGDPHNSAIGERHARAGGYYLGRDHGLIHRHFERITIAADHTARWQLSIDLELPTSAEASCEAYDGEHLFLFPLMFLKKAEGRTGFSVCDESGASLSLPTRLSCDWISATAASAASERIVASLQQVAGDEGQRIPSQLCGDDLTYALQCIARQPPYDAAVILNELLQSLDPLVRRAWNDLGLTSDLKMLVEHWLLWIPIRGVPGERRQMTVGQDVELLPRPVFRWCVGDLSKRKQSDPKSPVLETGKVTYGKVGRRIDISVLGERLALPLAWMPIDFDFPTIYTRRCSSYHFELVCPNGLSPRGIKIATDRMPHPDEKGEELDGGETLGTRAGRAYLSGGRLIGDVTVRATVGIGRGAFPILWLLMGFVTSVMLWSLVAAHPLELIETNSNSKNEILAGILLVVPALLGAIAIGLERSITRLISGARLLLLTTGFASAAAATVLIGKRPLDIEPLNQWAICAAIATAATVPLATSWLLSLPLARRQLQKLATIRAQYVAFVVMDLVAIAMATTLIFTDDIPLLQGWLAIGLLVMTVPMSLLASNRLPIPIVKNRDFISVGTIFAAFICLILGCLELHTAILHGDNDHRTVELGAIALLVLAIPLGALVRGIASRFWEKQGEVHIARNDAKELLEGKRLSELVQLRPPDEIDHVLGQLSDPYSPTRIDRPMMEEMVGSSEGAWSWGVRSTVHLPGYSRTEFEHLLGTWPRTDEPGTRQNLEIETKEKLSEHMGAIKAQNPCA